jgi:hypothetical protein
MYLLLLCVVHSNAKEDINLLQLQQLYNRVIKQQSLASGTATQQSFFQHWEQLAGGSEREKQRQTGFGSCCPVALRDCLTHGPCCLLSWCR